MDWKPLLVFAIVVIAFLLIKRSGQISADEAREELGKGAAVIDVRSPGEFQSGHLPQAVSIPLDRIESALPKEFPDKDAVLLLHCASGTRSGIAVRKLKALGYSRVHNLGSYHRAGRIVNAR
jgi:rhodanese-related sulfurtransferase